MMGDPYGEPSGLNPVSVFIEPQQFGPDCGEGQSDGQANLSVRCSVGLHRGNRSGSQGGACCYGHPWSDRVGSFRTREYG